MPNIFHQNLKSPLKIKVEWERPLYIPPLTLSISALMLDKNGIADTLEKFIFYGSPNYGNNIISSDKSITCNAINFDNGFETSNSYNMHIELDRIKPNVNTINIIISINIKEDHSPLPCFDSLCKASFCIKDSNGLTYTTELNKNKQSSCRCIQVGLIKRYGDSWRFEDELEFKLGGLELIYNEYLPSSIVKENPFSKIGNLNKIEKKYKENDNIIPIKPDQNISNESHTDIYKEKPWMKFIHKHNEPSSGDSLIKIKDNVVSLSPDNTSNKKSWRKNIEKTSNKAMSKKIDIQPSQVEEPPKRKFPKIKLSQENKVDTPSSININSEVLKKRKYPKVKK